MLLLGGVSANAEDASFDIVTSCGAVHHVSNVGKNVTVKQLVKFAQYIDFVYCG